MALEFSCPVSFFILFDVRQTNYEAKQYDLIRIKKVIDTVRTTTSAVCVLVKLDVVLNTAIDLSMY